LSVNEKNLKAIKKAVCPKTQTQLRSFLGMCNVYRRFTVDFAETAKPLNDLNSVKLPKRLSPPIPEEQAAFDKLREQLCHPPILAIPRKEGKYIIDVDASYDQLVCCLLQQQPDDKYLPVGYLSKGQLPAENNIGKELSDAASCGHIDCAACSICVTTSSAHFGEINSNSTGVMDIPVRRLFLAATPLLRRLTSTPFFGNAPSPSALSD